MATIFITGASSGIGAASAKKLAQEGWTVIASMRNLEKGSFLKDIPGIHTVQLDITNREQIQQVVKDVLEQYDVDVLFNNAGYGLKGPLESVEDAELRKLYDTDLIGTVQVTQAFIPWFKKRKKGLILTTGSLAGIVSFPLDGVYGASKRALAGMCESLYYEMRMYGVSVKLLLPGAIKTPFVLERHSDPAYEASSKRLTRMLIPDFEKQFPAAEDAAEIVLEAVTDGKNQFHYLIGDAAKEIYQKYMEMGIEEFKEYFYHALFEG